MKVNVILS
jgi:phosphoribosylformimino-5-aminoimidazole carboxamide ribotide isomerase